MRIPAGPMLPDSLYTVLLTSSIGTIGYRQDQWAGGWVGWLVGFNLQIILFCVYPSLCGSFFKNSHNQLCRLICENTRSLVPFYKSTPYVEQFSYKRKHSCSYERRVNFEGLVGWITVSPRL